MASDSLLGSHAPPETWEVLRSSAAFWQYPDMDQGVAAVLGAAVGVVGAMGAATVTYFGVRHQAAVTAESEHRRTIRTERVEAFAAFIESVQGAHDALIDARVQLLDLGSAPDVTEMVEEAQSALEHLRAAKSAIGTATKWQAKILVLGPQGLVESSHNVLQALRARLSVLGRVMPGMINGVVSTADWQEREDEHSQSWANSFGRFTARAAHALEGREIPTPRSD
ncbi:hypothetical protein OG895_21865 [Streptomyces sp. NBC_00201]|uniref:hypothetical protein n=1 Tax=Streptomyces sp. NBC_00201 TaxID=2975679 RepID=UPI00225AE380|nr:hypothetical protein [Streptomyces sp. NBC_00201]MCX5247825.1 hypothetical protein [Streptomyces sp. NBC_00201]